MLLHRPLPHARWLALMVSAVLALSTLLPRVGASEGPTVTMYRGDAAHTGTQPGPVPEGNPAVLWSFRAGAAVRSSPAVADGVAYVGSKDGNVYAIEIATGTERWRLATGGQVVASPAVADGVVYVGSYDGFFYALDADNGEVRWRVRTGSARSATVFDDAVYIATSAPAVRVLDAATGIERWHTAFNCEYVNEVAVAGQTVYVATSNQLLQALDRSTGRLRWFHQLSGTPTTSPVLSGGSVYLTLGTNAVVSVEAAAAVEDGAGAQAAEDDETQADEILSGGAGVVPGPAQIVAIDAETGELRWRHDLTVNRSVRVPPAVADGVVVVGTDAGTILGLDAVSGLELWGFQADGSINSAPALASGQVIAGAYDGAVHALDLRSGALQWSLGLGAPVLSSPAVVDGVVYVGHDGGSLVAIGALADAEQGS